MNFKLKQEVDQWKRKCGDERQDYNKKMWEENIVRVLNGLPTIRDQELTLPKRPQKSMFIPK